MFIEEWVYQKLLREQQERLAQLVAYIPFHYVSSEKFAKTEQELKAYDMPITQIITDNSVKDLQNLIDKRLIESMYIPLELVFGDGRKKDV